MGITLEADSNTMRRRENSLRRKILRKMLYMKIDNERIAAALFVAKLRASEPDESDGRRDNEEQDPDPKGESSPSRHL
jgi:hypothetical protein